MSALTTTTRPSAPVTARHKAILGRDIELATNIADNDPLIPLDDCRAIIAEMDRALVGCDLDAAKDHARMIVASYGAQKPDDVEIYIRMVTTVVAKCPPDLLVALVDEVTRRHPRVLPTKGEVEAVVSELRIKRSNAAWVAKCHVRAHEKRAANAKSEVSAEDRESFLARMREKCPEVFGGPLIKSIEGDDAR